MNVPLARKRGSTLTLDQKRKQDVERHKRRLIVRDWFFYVVWYIRLKKIVKELDCSTNLLEGELKRNPEYYDKLIKATGGGI
jgi:hypothetical protein